MEAKFQINYLDHLGIMVADLDISANWYETVLGLEKHVLPVWGAFPIFMLKGKTGVALFPKTNPISNEKVISNRKADHFAFNVSPNDFQLAKEHLEKRGISYEFQDHHYFHSIYMKDPDEHVVELTTMVVPEAEFYGVEP